MTNHLIIASLFTFFALLLFKNSDRAEGDVYKKIFYICLAAGIFIRVYYAFGDKAFYTGVGLFKAWAEGIINYGPHGIYENDAFFLDYPPGYMYVLSLVGYIHSLFPNMGQNVYNRLVKAVPVLADIAAAVIVYKIGKKHLGENKAAVLGAVMALAPAAVINSALWGQIDGFFTLFLTLAIFMRRENKTVPAALFYAVTLLVKPQALLFGPIFLFYIIERNSLKELAKAVGTGIGSMYLLSLPFAPSANPIWLFNLYKSTFGGYKYFTLNSYNLYMMFNMNWKSLEDIRGASLINAIVIPLAVLVCFVGYFTAKGKEKNFSSGICLIGVFFAFCTMMHERYLFPAMLLAVFAYIYSRDKKWFNCFCLAQLIVYLNTAASYESQYSGVYIDVFFRMALSAATVFFGIYVIFLQLDLSVGIEEKLKEFFKRENIWDICRAAVTAVFALFVFWNVGASAAPVDYFQSLGVGHSFFISFDKTEQVEQIQYYSCLSDPKFSRVEGGGDFLCDFTVMYRDGDGFFRYLTDINADYPFTWNSADVSVQTDGVLISAAAEGRALGEIVFLDQNGQIIRGTANLVGYEDTHHNGYHALNESHLLPVKSEYYHEMYFDEVYFARTAYEQLNGLPIYENTHPPLGKTLISLGIMSVGMSPLGYRFMGVIAGIAMVWVIYRIGCVMLKNKFSAFCMSAFLAADFMHYTLSRMATADIFLGLFTLLMFLYMAKYAHLHHGSPKSEQYLTLLVSGIFMGCAIGIKWSGAFAVPALAVYFFLALRSKYRRQAAEDKKQAGKSASGTCLWCVFAFGIAAFAVYFASFLPVLNGEGAARTVGEFIERHKNMLSYHSGLTAQHPFASAWYSWIFNIKPVWLFSGSEGVQKSTIALMGNVVISRIIPFAVAFCGVHRAKTKDTDGGVIALGYFACLLPWEFIGRITFIYHYFPAMLFGILAVGYCIDRLLLPLGKKGKAAAAITVALSGAAFLIYLPVIGGFPVSGEYTERLKLLPGWYF